MPHSLASKTEPAFLSPALAGLLRDAVVLLGTDERQATQFARHGVLVADGVTLVVCDLPAVPGTMGHDMMVSASLGDARATSIDHAHLLLRVNLMMGPTAGLSFAALDDGAIELIHPSRRADHTPATLGDKLHQMATLCRGVIEQLTADTDRQTAVTTAETGAA